MNNDEAAIHNGNPWERREPSFLKPGTRVTYAQTAGSRNQRHADPATVPLASNLPNVSGAPGASGSSAAPGAPGAPSAPSAPSASSASGAPVAPNAPVAQNPADTLSNNPGGNATTAASGESDQPPIPELERMKGVGDTLNGRFVLEECIGFGGLGMVYKALDLRKLEASDRKPYIAIKVLNVQFRGHPKSLIALQREARKAQALAHPNIVAVYDFDRDGSMVYLTMEYLVGQPLSGLLRAPEFNGLPLPASLQVVSGMAKALAYAHQRGFVHCDLKPGNVFLTERGDVKVIDFGIARVFQKTEEDMDATVFDAGSLGGLTPAYASPEMLEHRVPDPRDDIYALACITYELLTGRHPFDRIAATQARGTGMKPLRPRGISARQWRALKAALSFERELRTPSVMQFFDDISATRPPLWLLAGIGAAALTMVLGATALLYYLSNPRDATTTPGHLEATTAPGLLAPSAKPPIPQLAAPSRALPPLSMAAVTPLLARVPCSALTASVNAHTVEVRGFLQQAYGVARLKAELARVEGVEQANVDVRQIEQRQCGVIDLLGPYWIKSRQSGATLRTRAANGQLQEGDPLMIDLTTPSYDTLVYVDYFVRDGGVAHLLPSVRARDNQAPASYSATIGSFGDWVISAPFGTELIAMITTPAPLFSGLRPEAETGTEYLRKMKRQLRHMSEKYGADRIAVDLLQITTRARTP